MKANNNTSELNDSNVPVKKEWHWPVTTRRYKESDFFDDSDEGELIRAVDLEVGDVVRMCGDNLFWLEDFEIHNIDERDDNNEDDENHPIDPEKIYVNIMDETWNPRTHKPKSVMIENIPGTALVSVFRLKRKTERKDLG